MSDKKFDGLVKYAAEKLDDYVKKTSDDSTKKRSTKVEFKSLEPKEEEKTVPPPPKLTIKKGTLLDRILGCIYGGIIGDILGSGIEMKKESFIKSEYGGLETIDLTKKLMDKGHATDDTAFTMAIIQDITAFGGISPHSIGERFYKLFKMGIRGMGGLTRDVLKVWDTARELTSFTMQQIAESVWERSKRQRAGNGGVMRTAPIGIFAHNSVDTLVDYTAKVCQLTHADPRCINSAVAVSLAVALLLNEQYTLKTVAEKVNEETGKILHELRDLKYDALKIDGDDAGFTYTTLRAAFLVFHMANDFEDGMLKMLRKGGDTDTNACVVGQMLGARFGLTGIPKLWILLLKTYPQIIFDVSTFAKKFFEEKTEEVAAPTETAVETSK